MAATPRNKEMQIRLDQTTLKDIQKGVYRFLTPEQVDELVKSKIDQFAKKGGKGNSGVRWTEGELQLRHSVILEYICEQGLSRENTAKQISERWNVNISTARRYVREAVESLTKDYDEYVEEVRKTHLERLETILQKALKNDRQETALKVMDQIAKVQGLYEQKIDLNAKTDTTITFDFS